MYDKELIMGVLVASSTLVGLAGLLMALSTQLERKIQAKPVSIYALCISVLAGLSAVIWSLIWFIGPSTLPMVMALGSFLLQIIVFLVLVMILGVRSVKET